ncbi:hypothetical protein EMPS_09872 [Entomortierella parvispora]|uniref:AAA-ATPase-like domain-containing protein n=1 Tax=Entomortierella parvispora TaxID=205924 RepID=A0A9P3M0Q5_9FUNG|nr:hypothetical protein EMPS_09872 [Entomortierella parvispora]
MANPLLLNCIVKDDVTPFPVQTLSTETVGLLKDAIKTALELKIPAKDLTLWKVPEGTPEEQLSSVCLNDANKMNPLLRLQHQELFPHGAADGIVHVVVQPPDLAITSGKRKWLPTEPDGRIVRTRLEAPPYDSRNASMSYSKESFRGFPLNDKRSFGTIRTNMQYAYFDRTRYITVLESSLQFVHLFLRPRRFGKSLFLSTLAFFHGVEHKENHDQLFQGLDVSQDIESGKVTPGQYLILSFDFSAVSRSPDMKAAERSLAGMINNSTEDFYQLYAPYLGEYTGNQLTYELISSSDPVISFRKCVTLVQKALNAAKEVEDPLFGVKGIYLLADEYDAISNEYLDPNDPKPWERLRSNANSLLKAFWGTVKSKLEDKCIVKCFITGVSPLSMADPTSGFNVAQDISWEVEFSGLCGLTEEDIYAALRLLRESRPQLDVDKHLDIMKVHYNGYVFAPSCEALHVFNTNTCFEYLANLAKGREMNPSAVSNSEVSERALQILAASPIASKVIKESLTHQTTSSDNVEDRAIPYGELVKSFRLTDLASDIATSKNAWLCYMVHIGGLTFCGDSKLLRIPNQVAAIRFGNATLERHKLRLEDVDLAFQNIVSDGDICQALALYKRIMEMRDVGVSDFKKTEENHRDCFYIPLFGNSHPSLRKIGLEVQVTTTSQNSGRIDMLILIPLKKRVLLLEWKVIQIDFLDINRLRGFQKKADYLKDMNYVNDVLDLKFVMHDVWRPGQTIRDWILNGAIKGANTKSPREQLAKYVESPEIMKLKEDNDVTAYLVVVIGSRQILFWELDNGQFKKDPHLAA